MIRNDYYNQPNVDTIPNAYHGVRPRTHAEIRKAREAAKTPTLQVKPCPN